ncbi:MAG TPA: anti-sigma factor [Burkholderiales bacterium]|nr:anti-sigma factor [Burkholderiales bacterium]
MNCTDSRSRLHAYLDQELDLPSVLAIDEHLASCDACKKTFAQQFALQSGVRKHAMYYTAPGTLTERIRGAISRTVTETSANSVKPHWQWPLFQRFQLGAAVAATALVSWIVAIQYNTPSEAEFLAEQVIASHARSTLTTHLADVSTSDEHTVKPWLSSKLDFSPPVTDLTGAGFPLVGGRLDYLDNRPVAALVYGHRQHVINLFVWPDRRSGRSLPMESLSKHGYNVLHWINGGMAFWAISDLNATEMRAFAEAYTGAK